MRRLRLAIVSGILAAGLVLSTGEVGCPPGFHHADGGMYGTCIGVEAGQVVTASPRVVWR